MKNNVFLFSLLVFVAPTSSAQVKQVDKKNNALTIGLYTPISDFSDSHVIGAGVDYRLIPFYPHKDSNNIKRFVFVMSGGFHYYFGKSSIVNGYEFDFGNLMGIHIMPGLLYYPFKRSFIQLSAGPGASLYKNNFRIGVGANLFAGYYLTEKISIGPAIHFNKFSKTAALWSLGVSATYFL